MQNPPSIAESPATCPPVNGNREIQEILTTISSIFIRLNHEMRVERWNQAATRILGISDTQTIGQVFTDLPIEWDIHKITTQLEQCSTLRQITNIEDINFIQTNGRPGLLGITVHPIVNHDDFQGFILLGADITGKKVMQAQWVHAQKLEALGQLSSAISHEINTPVQYIGDNLDFMIESIQDLQAYIGLCEKLIATATQGTSNNALLDQLQENAQDIDLEFLNEEMPKALTRSLEGVHQIAKIVRSMKEFSHPGCHHKSHVDINQGLISTVTVTKNIWKYEADVHTRLDNDLPRIWAHSNALNQVFLNMIINAVQAIGETRRNDPDRAKGTITIRTWSNPETVFIQISDDGPGIPEDLQDRIFDPFFTTRDVGAGSGQGLFMSHQVIVDDHGGHISVESRPGQTDFTIELPIET